MPANRETVPAPPAGDTRRLFHNIAAMLLLQGASYVLPLLTLPYLARVLGPSHFGLVAFAQAAVQYLVIFTDFGFNLSATRAISVRREDPAAVATLFSAVMGLKTILALLGAAVLLVAACFAPVLRQEWRLFASAYGLVVGSVLFPVWFFQGMERMRFIAGLTILAKLVFTGLVFVFVREDTDYVLVPLLNSVGTIAAAAASLWIVFSIFRVRPRAPTVASMREAYRDSVGYFLSRVSVTVYTTSNVFLLGAVSTASAAGLYSAAEKIYGAMQGVYSPVTNALLPYMARTRNLRVFARLMAVASLANAAVCILVAVYATPIVKVAFGAPFAQAAAPLALLAVAMVFVLPNFFLGYPLLAAFGHARLANLSTIAGSVFHLSGLGLLFLLGRFTPQAVAAMVLATEVLVLIGRLYAVKRTALWSAAA